MVVVRNNGALMDHKIWPELREASQGAGCNIGVGGCTGDKRSGVRVVAKCDCSDLADWLLNVTGSGAE